MATGGLIFKGTAHPQFLIGMGKAPLNVKDRKEDFFFKGAHVDKDFIKKSHDLTTNTTTELNFTTFIEKDDGYNLFGIFISFKPKKNGELITEKYYFSGKPNMTYYKFDNFVKTFAEWLGVQIRYSNKDDMCSFGFQQKVKSELPIKEEITQDLKTKYEDIVTYLSKLEKEKQVYIDMLKEIEEEIRPKLNEDKRKSQIDGVVSEINRQMSEKDVVIKKFEDKRLATIEEQKNIDANIANIKLQKLRERLSKFEPQSKPTWPSITTTTTTTATVATVEVVKPTSPVSKETKLDTPSSPSLVTMTEISERKSIDSWADDADAEVPKIVSPKKDNEESKKQ